MKIENSRKRFKKRIEFERKILTIINSNFIALHGLSSAAISSWHNNLNINDSLKNELKERIINLSNDLMVFCDMSKNNFDFTLQLNEHDINQKILNLEKFVIRCKF